MLSHTNILLPSQFNIINEQGNKGVYEIEGLYPGYGHTLGNSLRRIILSSIPGVAIVGVKIEGAEHEYSTLKGVKEDALNILLNLKKVRLETLIGDLEEEVTVTLKANGVGDVIAADIETGGVVRVTNGDQHIATLTDKNSALSIELTLQQGNGFLAARDIQKTKRSVGDLAIDAVFSPVRKVRYEVEDMRVGSRTDHNRLRIHIETDGTITPQKVLELSITIMLHQLGAILSLSEDEFMPERKELVPAGVDVEEEEKLSAEALADILKTRVESLELSSRTHNALEQGSIRTVGGLVKKTAEDLMSLEGVGAKAVEEIQQALEALGVSLNEKGF